MTQKRDKCVSGEKRSCDYCGRKRGEVEVVLVNDEAICDDCLRDQALEAAGLPPWNED